MSDEMTLIGQRGEFALYERTDHSKDGWRNLKLIRSGKAKKNNWWLGWNGERLSDSRDARLLAAFDPEIRNWVIATLGAAA